MEGLHLRPGQLPGKGRPSLRRLPPQPGTPLRAHPRPRDQARARVRPLRRRRRLEPLPQRRHGGLLHRRGLARGLPFSRFPQPGVAGLVGQARRGVLGKGAL